MVPGRSLAAAIRAFRPGGRYLHGNPRLSIVIRAPFDRRFTSNTATCAFARESRDELLALKAMIEEGALTSNVDRVLPMAEAAEGLVESEARRGAVVLAIGPDAGGGWPIIAAQPAEPPAHARVRRRDASGHHRFDGARLAVFGMPRV